MGRSNIAVPFINKEVHGLAEGIVLGIWFDLESNVKIWTHFSETKYIKNQNYKIIKVVLPFLYSSMKIKNHKYSVDF